MPCATGCVVPCIVNGFHRDGICAAHLVDSCVDQSAAYPLSPVLFTHVNGVDNSNPTRLDDRRNGLPVIYPTDQEPGQRPVGLCHESKAIGLPEPASEPLFHCGLGIRP